MASGRLACTARIPPSAESAVRTSYPSRRSTCAKMSTVAKSSSTMSTVGVWAPGCFLARKVFVVEGASAGPGPGHAKAMPSGRPDRIKELWGELQRTRPTSDPFERLMEEPLAQAVTELAMFYSCTVLQCVPTVLIEQSR